MAMVYIISFDIRTKRLNLKKKKIIASNARAAQRGRKEEKNFFIQPHHNT